MSYKENDLRVLVRTLSSMAPPLPSDQRACLRCAFLVRCSERVGFCALQRGCRQEEKGQVRLRYYR